MAENAKSIRQPKKAGKRAGRERSLRAPVVLLVASGEIWLTLAETCSLTRWTERHVRRTAGDESWATRASELRGRNGKQQREYALSSLPSRLIWRWFNLLQKRRNRSEAAD